MASLKTYRNKRNFKSTPEPEGLKAAKSGNSFVIQKHAARRLHYDFRLEMDGVLKSWAVTRGPSLIANEKRLAVHVEDHPLEYGDFEGTIPKGEYGAGTVIIWDWGTWSPVHDADKGYTKGHLEFELHGKKLQGRWHLVRMHGKLGEKRENWLLIKADDDAARPSTAPDILEELPESVKTGRLIEDIVEERTGLSSRTGQLNSKIQTANKTAPTEARTTNDLLDLASRPNAQIAPLPDFIEPALASLKSKPPKGDRWLHEIKFDGYRIQARLQVGQIKLLTRSGLDWTKKFGKEVANALQSLPIGTALIDGEMVVENIYGASDFSYLQDDLSHGRTDRFIFYVFDLIYLDGYDLRKLALLQRKEILGELVDQEAGALRLSSPFDEDGELILKHACRLGLEGVISKLKDAPYYSGRGKSWIKSKCSARQEFVIGGYSPSSTSRNAVGSLLLGIYNNGLLEYVGRVGTGFSHTVAEALFRQLQKLHIKLSPFSKTLTPDQARQAHYVQPELVAEVEFQAWTAYGQLRHASFHGLRNDKPATQIIREVSKMKSPAKIKTQHSTIKLTHPDRIYWPDQGVTKQGLADYYTDIWPFIAHFITQRPLALLRAPSGITGDMFFQKHAWKGLNPNIVLIDDPTKADDEPLISIQDIDGLISLVQAAVLEIHPWGSSAKNLELPDQITMDLDPGEGVVWQAIINAAEETRQRLEAAGLTAFVKTSGGKGLHVVAPLKPKANWSTIKAFTKNIADSMAADNPGKYVSTITKSKRKGKILIDYLRNQRGMTAVAPYSTRARPGAAISMPLEWDELNSVIGPAYFTIKNTPTRLATLKTDPWREFHRAAVPLNDR